MGTLGDGIWQELNPNNPFGTGGRRSRMVLAFGEFASLWILPPVAVEKFENV